MEMKIGANNLIVPETSISKEPLRIYLFDESELGRGETKVVYKVSTLNPVTYMN
jgi:hypothetical protein